MNDTLSAYVKRRTGLALGESGSMKNMLKRSFGAGSFAQFWQFWNPIWGYYLRYKVFLPSKRVMPTALAIVVTFAVSGAIHDLAIILVKWRPTLFFTPWFTLMGVVVVLTSQFKLRYSSQPWVLRSLINLSLLVICYLFTSQFFYSSVIEV